MPGLTVPTGKFERQVVRRDLGRDRPNAACCDVPSRRLPAHEHLFARANRLSVAAVTRTCSLSVVSAAPCVSLGKAGRAVVVEVESSSDTGSDSRAAGIAMHPVRTRMIAMTIAAQNWAKPGDIRRRGESAGTKWLLAGGPDLRLSTQTLLR